MRRRLHDLGGRDPYELLGVDPDATKTEIITAYRRRVREIHPDRPGGDENETKLLHLARDVLLDRKERGEYDRLRAEVQDPSADAPPASSAWDSDDVVNGAMAPPPPTRPFRPPAPPGRPSYPPPYPPPMPPYPPPPPPYAWPHRPPPRPATSGLTLGVWALILSVLCTPVGLVPGIIALSRRPPSGSADQICAIIAVCLSALGLFMCGGWMLAAVFSAGA